MFINGQTFFMMMISAANALDNNKVHINNMNIFPVPDGDTGINMSLTMSTIKTLSKFDGTISDCAEKASHLTLRAARGNSGAILSLFFRGMSKSLGGLDTADTSDMAAAFRRGTDEAYKAVMNPTEGTILSVMKACTEEAEAVHEKYKGNMVNFFKAIVKSAEEALAKTPDQLPVLKEVNLVDAGGYGFVVILSGMLSALQNNPVVAIKPAVQSAKPESVFSEFNTKDIKFTYCTECIVDKKESYRGDGTCSELRAYIGELGDSVVFVDDEDMIKLHVHTNNPGLVMEKALEFGSLATVKIENMRNQHTEIIDAPADVAEASTAVLPATKKYGFVSVCMGDGIKATFEDLGADSIIFGGQTMNPSTQDIIDGVNKTPSEYVFICPNNKNIYMVAEQAASLITDKKVIVLPTKSVPHGISAMLAFDPDADVDDNVEAMKEAIQSVTSASVTYAVRDTAIDGKCIECGQYLGILNGDIDTVADSTLSAAQSLAEHAKGKSFITIFYGEDASESEAESVAELFREKAGRFAEVNLIPGGQPIYPYIISIE